MPLSLATVVTPVLEKVATPSGTVAGVQLFGSTHSLGSPPLPPTDVASTAWAATTPRAVEASRMASEWRPIDCKPAPRLANRVRTCHDAPQNSQRKVGSIRACGGWRARALLAGLSIPRDRTVASEDLPPVNVPVWRLIISIQPDRASERGSFA